MYDLIIIQRFTCCCQTPDFIDAQGAFLIVKVFGWYLIIIPNSPLAAFIFYNGFCNIY